MNKSIALALLLVLAAGCVTQPRDGTPVPPMDATRAVSEQDCTKPLADDGANLKCREISERERQARIAAAEREIAARLEAAARAERERLEQLAREEAARKAREAEEARLAAERRRLEEEAARKAREAEEARLAAERRRLEEEAARKAKEERERKEREEAERIARLKAEQEAREAAAAECRRLEHERNEGRSLLEVFVADYGKDEEFKEIAGQISAFLNKPRRVKPCPPA